MPKSKVRNKGKPKKAFVPNKLQSQLHSEVLNGVFGGPKAAPLSEDWFIKVRPQLTHLARLGRAVAQQDTLEGQFYQLRGLSEEVPDSTLRWLHDFACLRDLVSPWALEGLEVKAVQARYRQLGTLDANLNKLSRTPQS